MMKKAIAILLIALALPACGGKAPGKAEIEKPAKVTGTPEELLDAVSNADVEEIRKLLTGGLDVNSGNEVGTTALHIAALDGNVEVLHLLLDSGANPNVRDKHGDTPLLIAVTHSVTDAVKLLLEHGANPNSKDTDGNNILHLVTEDGFGGVRPILHQGELNIARLLIENGADVNVRDNAGNALLHKMLGDCVEYDDFKFLLSKGADPDVQNSKGETPLHVASKYPDWRPVKWLLESGADPNSTDKEGETPIEKQAEEDYFGYRLAHLRKHGAKTTKFSTDIVNAARYGDTAKVEEFLQSGVGVNTKDDSERTALHYAGQHGDKALVLLLLAYDADVNARDDRATPLCLAAEMGHADIVDILLSRGADLTQFTRLHETALHLSVECGHEEVAKILVEKGISLEEINRAFRTALHEAVVGKHENIAKFLIASGAKVNVKDQYGCTPLHYAAEKGLPAVAGALINKGAGLDEPSTYSGMPLHRAVLGRRKSTSDKCSFMDRDNTEEPLKPGALEVAKMLLSKGAKPNVMNPDGQTPLDMALGMKDDEMVKLLQSHGAKQASELEKEAPPEGKNE
jgi:ankyrin repeat protein